MNLITARIFNLAVHDDGTTFNENKILLLADDLKERIRRFGNPKLYKEYVGRLDSVKTRDQFLKIFDELVDFIKKSGFNEEKIACVQAYTKRMLDIDQKTCKKFYSALENDYDIVTIDREAKMLTTVKNFDENGNVLSLFEQDSAGNLQTYTDKDGRVRYKINKKCLDFDNFNRLAKFLTGKCEKIDINKKIHVNALIWHDAIPEQINMLAKSDLDFQEKKRRCEDFLYGYINEFAKNAEKQGVQLDSVEVLNEIASDEPKQTGALRDSVWRDLLGDDYPIECFKMAKDAFSSSTKLFYNDYSEFRPEKKANILAIVKEFQKAESELGRLLLDGIGLQCHLFGDAFDYDASIKEYLATAKSGAHPKEVRITEIDSADCQNPSWQTQQMKDCIKAAMNNGLETVSCWSDFSPFVDHLENTTNIGLLAPDGQTTEVHKFMHENFSAKTKEAETETERSLTKNHTT